MWEVLVRKDIAVWCSGYAHGGENLQKAGGLLSFQEEGRGSCSEWLGNSSVWKP